MPTKNLQNMNLDEVEAAKAAVKEKMEVLRAEYDELHIRRTEIVELQHVEEAMKQLNRVAEATDRTVEQVAADWIDDGDRGHYIQSKLYFDNKGSV